jgi:tetratricopeptide (TPR) repeat protein
LFQETPVTDIFVSYASEDRDRIAKLVTILEAEGWKVWWDKDLVVGADYEEEIEKALSSATCVLVAWSHHSIKSRWVRDEANEGSEKDILVPLIIDDIQPPLGFRSAQTANLTGWPDTTGELDRLLGGIRRLLESVRPTDNAMAFELYRQGIERVALYNRWDTQTAVEMLTRATTLDPNFADAWAHLADACINAIVFFGSKDTDLTLLAADSVDNALRLDPDNVVALTTKARLLWSPGKGFQNREALHILDRTTSLSPNAHRVWVWQCCIFMHVGLVRESQTRLNKLAEVAVNDPLVPFFQAQANVYGGNTERAVEQHARAMSLDPTNQVVHLHYPGTWIYANELNQAEASVKNARQFGLDDAILTSSEALIWAKRGEKKKAESACQQTLVEMATSVSRVHTHHIHHNLGSAFALIDKPNTAIEQIMTAATQGFPCFPMYDSDDHLRSLHGHSDFENMLSGLRDDLDSYRSEFVKDED